MQGINKLENFLAQPFPDGNNWKLGNFHHSNNKALPMSKAVSKLSAEFENHSVKSWKRREIAENDS